LHTNLNGFFFFLYNIRGIYILSTVGVVYIRTFSSQKMWVHICTYIFTVINLTLKPSRYLKIDEMYTPASIIIISSVINFCELFEGQTLLVEHVNYPIPSTVGSQYLSEFLLLGNRFSGFHHWFVVCQNYRKNVKEVAKKRKRAWLVN